MRPITTLTATLLSYLLFVSPLSSAAAAQISDSDLNSVLRAANDQPGFSGAILAMRNGIVVSEFYTGMADKAAGEPITESTLFNNASSSKLYTSYMLRAALERAGLSMQTAVNTQPGLEDHFDETVTVADLLKHRTDIGQVLFQDAPASDISAAENNDQLFQIIVAHVQKPIGKRTGGPSYRNENYIIAGHILASLTGKSFEQNLMQLAAQAGAEDGIYIGKKSEANRTIATGYVHAGFEGADIRAETRRARNATEFPEAISTTLTEQVTSAGGGLYVTARAQAKILSYIANMEGVLAAQCRLDAPTERGGRTAYSGYGCIGRSLGAAGPSVGHGGGAPGINSILQWYPEQDLVLIVLSNHFGKGRPVLSMLDSKLSDMT